MDLKKRITLILLVIGISSCWPSIPRVIKTPRPINPLIGNLFIANAGNNSITEFNKQEIILGGNIAPQVTLLNPFANPTDTALNVAGDIIWVANQGSNLIVAYKLPLSPDSFPFFILNSPAIKSTNNNNSNASVGFSIAVNPFDDSLWIGNVGDNTVLKFSSPLANPNALPSLIITGFNVPSAVRFDNNNDLWIANFGLNNIGHNTVVKYNNSQLSNTGIQALVPDQTIDLFPGSDPVSIAFNINDVSNNLWVGLGGQSIGNYDTNTGLPNCTFPISTNDTAFGLTFDSSNKLWVTGTIQNSNKGHAIYYYPQPFTGTGGCPLPGTQQTFVNNLEPPPGGDPSTAYGPAGPIFDASGNLYVALFGNNQLLKYSPLINNNVVVTLPKLATATGPAGIAFDKDLNLWVANAEIPNSIGTTINKFTASQLLTSGSPIPDLQISGGSSGYLQAPFGLAFDSKGNLWVSNAHNNTVIAYSASDLTIGGELTPIVIISSPSFSAPTGIAFDAEDNLYVVNNFFLDTGNMCNPTDLICGSIDIFANALLQPPGGAIIPSVIIEDDGTKKALNNPSALAFDFSTGDLWVSNLFNGTIVKYNKNQIDLVGISPRAPTPIKTINIPNGGASGLAFDAFNNLWVLDFGAFSQTPDAVLRYNASTLLMPTPLPDAIIRGPRTFLSFPLGGIAIAPALSPY